MNAPVFQSGPAERTGGVLIAQGGIPDDLRSDWTRPRCARVILVLSGKGRLHRPHASRSVAKGTVLLLQDSRRHSGMSPARFRKRESCG